VSAYFSIGGVVPRIGVVRRRFNMEHVARVARTPASDDGARLVASSALADPRLAGFDTLAAFRHTLPAALRAAIDVGFERTDLATFRGVLLALCAPGPTGDDDPRSSPMGGGDDGGQRSSPAGGGDDSSISGSVQK
jgi:hypothetical protein